LLVLSRSVRSQQGIEEETADKYVEGDGHMRGDKVFAACTGVFDEGCSRASTRGGYLLRHEFAQGFVIADSLDQSQE
jgi:hypothetical protein